MNKQVIFMDASGCVYGGIQLENGNIICGCCGTTVAPHSVKVLHEYPTWCNISYEITGSDEDVKDFESQVDGLRPDEVVDVFFGHKKLELKY